jgi:hypothetical protein
MALADLIAHGKWRPQQSHEVKKDRQGNEFTPTSDSVKSSLAPEPITRDPKAVDRNSARTAAQTLLTVFDGDNSATKTGASDNRVEIRASRGRLGEAVDFALQKSKDIMSLVTGGTKAADKLDVLVGNSGLVPALELWAAAYRVGETDPVKLKMLLDNVTASARKIAANVKPGANALQLPLLDQLAAQFWTALEVPLTEVAFEASELLRSPPSFTSEPLAGPALKAARDTRQSLLREAAVALESKGGLPKVVDMVLTGQDALKGLRDKSWAKTLRTAAEEWALAQTRDPKQVVTQASGFLQALGVARSDVTRNGTPGEVIVGERIIDALAFAFRTKIAQLGEADAQIEAQTTRLVASLADFQQPAPTIDNLAAYWRAAKGKLKGVPSGLDLAAKLSVWQKAVADPTNTAGLSKATYDVVAALNAYRTGLTEPQLVGGLGFEDSVRLLQALDELGVAIGSKMSTLQRGPSETAAVSLAT